MIVTALLLLLTIQTTTNGQYPNERDALLKLRDTMSSDSNLLHRRWTGPPCNGNRSRWIGVSCDSGHVIGLTLDGIHLTGLLPPSILLNFTMLTTLNLSNNSIFGSLPNLTNLLRLENLDLSNNRFTGSIPFHYVKLPRLTTLELQQNYLNGRLPPLNQPSLVSFNVSYNSLDGSIPRTEVLERFSSSSFEHNSGFCGSPLNVVCPPPPPSSVAAPKAVSGGESRRRIGKWSLVLTVGASAAVALLLVSVLICACVCYCRKRSSKPQATKDNTGVPISDEHERVVELQFVDKNVSGAFDLDELLRASAEVLGKGRLGTTYKATLDSGLVVAVKRLKSTNALNKKEFIQQMQLLGNMQHENLVRILSFYYSGDEKLVISEFVPDGNLFDLLHENRGVGRIPIPWRTRLHIIRDIAKGLSWLHQFLPNHKVPHGNLKSSNILLHRTSLTYHSKLSDFGFLTLKKSNKNLAVSRSPEFTNGKKLTHKTDVYCFGILLLEIVTGRVPGDESESGGGDLCGWVRNVVDNDWSTDILDVEIVGMRDGWEEMMKVTELALRCTDLDGEKRPGMLEVVRVLEEEIEEVN